MTEYKEPVLTVVRTRNGNYAFSCPSIKQHGDIYKCNGEVIEAGKVCTTEKIPVLELYHVVTRLGLGASNIEGVPDLSPSEYIEREDALLMKRKWTEELGYVWDTLEDEFEYRKFQRAYTQIKTPIEVFATKYKTVVHTEVPCDNPYLVPFRHLGYHDITSTHAEYKRYEFFVTEVRRILNNLKYKEIDPGHGLSAKGTYKIYVSRANEISLYIQGDCAFSLNNLFNMRDEYDVLLKQMNKDKDFINERIIIYVRGKDIPFNKHEAINILKTARNMLGKIACKVAGYSDKQALSNYLLRKIDEIEKSIIEGKDENVS